MPKETGLPWPSVSPLGEQRLQWRVEAVRVGRWLLWSALTLLCAALINPRVTKGGEELLPMPREGVGLYLLVDQSSAMGSQLPLAKELAREMATAHSNDLLGLVEFARVAKVVDPLTLDHQAVLSRIAAIQPISNPVLEGSAIGYAIFKTVNLIVATKYFASRLEAQGKPAYTMPQASIVVITAGVQQPNPADATNRWRAISQQDALAYAANNGVPVFYIGVDPSQLANVAMLQEATDRTGGGLWVLGPQTAASDLVSQTATGARASVGQELLRKELPLAPWMLGAALVCLAASLLIETAIARVVP